MKTLFALIIGLLGFALIIGSLMHLHWIGFFAGIGLLLWAYDLVN